MRGDARTGRTEAAGREARTPERRENDDIKQVEAAVCLDLLFCLHATVSIGTPLASDLVRTT